jgi:hypothetical protein
LCTATAPAAAAPGDAEIRGAFKDSPIVLTTTARLAGAVHSLTWNGREFVDSADHGRQIQTAWTVNDLGQCLNPTEAGAAADGAGPSSTSVLLECVARGNVLTTRSRPAYWLAPGVRDGGCNFDLEAPNPPWRGGTAVNPSAVSEDVLEKRVALGYAGMPNVIEYVSTITLADPPVVPVDHLILLNPCVYMPVDFSSAYRYDPAVRGRTAMPKPAYGYASVPGILATPDGGHALAVYTPEIPRSGFPGHRQEKYLGYEVIDWTEFGKVMMLGARMPKPGPDSGPLPPGPHTWRSFIAIGSLADVEEALDRLYAMHPPMDGPSADAGVAVGDAADGAAAPN